MDVERQVELWRAGADEDFAAARSLLDRGHPRHALFCAHLALEKALKAHVTHRTQDVPPRIHSLIRLAGMAGLTLDSEREEMLREFGVYQMAGRYPDSAQVPFDTDTASQELLRAEEMLEWLRARLRL